VHIISVYVYPAPVRQQDAHNELDEGGFTRSIRSHQAKDAAPGHLQVDIVQGGAGAKRFGQILNFDQL